MKKISLFVVSVLLMVFVAYNADTPYLSFSNVFGIVFEETFSIDEDEKVIDESSDFTLLAFGDLMLGRHVQSLMDKNSLDYPFEKLDLEALRHDVDIMHANFEAPVYDSNKKGVVEGAFDLGPFLYSHGFTVMSLANNSINTRGADHDMLAEEFTSAGLGWCGEPMSASEDSVFYGSANGLSYAFVCLHDVTKRINMKDATTLIQSLDSEVDNVIVSVHWGYEYSHKAHKTRQMNPAHEFVDAGADFVMGHHPHVVQNFEIYHDAPIFYSLGNFVFDQYFSKDVQEELGVKVVFDEYGVDKVTLIPMKSEKSQVRLMDEEEREKWLEKFIKYGDYDDDMKEMIREGVLDLK